MTSKFRNITVTTLAAAAVAGGVGGAVALSSGADHAGKFKSDTTNVQEQKQAVGYQGPVRTRPTVAPAAYKDQRPRPMSVAPAAALDGSVLQPGGSVRPPYTRPTVAPAAVDQAHVNPWFVQGGDGYGLAYLTPKD